MKGTANDGCALAGRAGRHTGTATTLVTTPFSIVIPFLIVGYGADTVAKSSYVVA